MFALIDFVRSLFDSSADTQQDRDNRYLSESTDIYDLERRMRQLDSGRHNLYAIGSQGIFTR